MRTVQSVILKWKNYDKCKPTSHDRPPELTDWARKTEKQPIWSEEAAEIHRRREIPLRGKLLVIYSKNLASQWVESVIFVKKKNPQEVPVEPYGSNSKHAEDGDLVR